MYHQTLVAYRSHQQHNYLQPGMHKCNNSKCKKRPYIKEGKKFKSNFTNKSVEVTEHYSWKELNCIYLIQCKKCDQQYTWERKNFYNRILQHLDDARNKKENKM